MTRLVVLQHLEREGPGLFAREALARGWDLLICRLDRGEWPPALGPSDCLLVLGGPMGVADLGDPAYPWLTAELELLRMVLPPQAQLLASSLHCREQAFRLGPLAYGLQFHVEVEPPMLERWLAEDSAYLLAALGPDGPARLRADARRWGERLQRQGRCLVANLFDQLAGGPDAGSTAKRSCGY